MKKCLLVLPLFLLLGLFYSCNFINTEKTSSIVIDFGSANHSRAAINSKGDLSYFVVSIEPKVQNDIKVDYINGETTAEFDALAEGFYKVLVSAFNTSDAKIASGESEQVEVKAGKTTMVSITMKAEDNTSVPEGLVIVAGVTIKGTENWVPSSSVFISGRQLTIPDLIVSDHELTRGEYKAVMGIDPSSSVTAYDADGNALTGDDLLNAPVVAVNWYDAIVYCNKASVQAGYVPCYSISGKTDPDAWGEVPTSADSETKAVYDDVTCNFTANGYRLPTEAEWEWLARGGEEFKYAGSDNIEDVAWYSDNTGYGNPRTVKTKMANGYGLYDMSGNASEWCFDWHGTINASSLDYGAVSGASRVIRGGDSAGDKPYCECSDRSNDYYTPAQKAGNIGFRVVRTKTN